MKFSIETVEETNFGDHGERLRKSQDVVPGETVEQMVARLFWKADSDGKGKFYSHNYTDEIIIRLVVPGDPATSPDPWRSDGQG